MAANSVNLVGIRPATKGEKMFIAHLHQKCRFRNIYHKRMHKRYELMVSSLNLVVACGTALSTMVASRELFAEHSDTPWTKLAGKVALSGSMTSACGVALNVSIRPKERGSKHLAVAKQYQDLEKDIEGYVRDYPRCLHERDKQVANIRLRYDAVLKWSPTLPLWIPCFGPPAKGKELIWPNPTQGNPYSMIPHDAAVVDNGANRDDFSEHQTLELIQQLVKLDTASEKSECKSAWNHALATVVGAFAGFVAIVGLAGQAESFTEAAPSLCHVIGAPAGLALTGIQLSHGPSGYQEKAKTLRACSTEMAAAALKIRQALFLKPHPDPAPMANQLIKMAEDVLKDKTIEVLEKTGWDMGEEVHIEALNLRIDKEKEILEGLRYQAPNGRDAENNV